MTPVKNFSPGFLRAVADIHFFLRRPGQDQDSANSHIIYLIRKNIEEFEKEHGKIEHLDEN